MRKEAQELRGKGHKLDELFLISGLNYSNYSYFFRSYPLAEYNLVIS